MHIDAAHAVRAEPDDADAMRRARDRPEAFAAVFDRHYRAVHSYLARRVGTSAADDLVSETFLRGLAAARYDLAYPDARPWLLGIATNVVGEHRRAEIRAYRALARSGVDPAHDHADAVTAATSTEINGRHALLVRGREIAEVQVELPDGSAVVLYGPSDLLTDEQLRMMAAGVSLTRG